MDAIVWTDVRADAADAFGEAVGDQLEQRLLRAFLENPQLVIKVIHRVKLMHAAGKVRSPWAVVDMNLTSAREQIKSGDKDEIDRRSRLVGNAELFVTNTGWQFPLDGLLDELFNESNGRLRDYDETALRKQVTDLWWSRQPPESEPDIVSGEAHGRSVV